MGRTRLSFAEMVAKAKVMATALKANATQVGKRGIDDTFISKMEELYTKALQLNNEQEKLKADLKLKTEELTQNVHEL